MGATIAGMTQKRGYSREFTPKTDRRIKREIDRVPPKLDEKIQAKLRRERVSLRWLTLTLWRMWVDDQIYLPGEASDV
jgi:hypothetical protein